MTTQTETVEVGYDLYRGDARDGDVLLWRPRDFFGEVIARETSGPYCHASAVVHVHDRPFQSAYAERMNGFLSPLSAEVRRNPGIIDVYRASQLTPGDLERIAWHLLEDLVGNYEWANIGHFALEATSVGRWLERLPLVSAKIRARRENLARSRSSAICSQHVARAYGRGAKIELCLGRSYSRTSPNDLARSPMLKYHATLAWPSNW